MSSQTVFQDILHSKKKIVLTLHQRPDGDSIGSNLALYEALTSLGCQVDLFSIDPVPEVFQFLHNIEKIQTKSPSQILWGDYDLYLALDMSAPDMLGETVSFPKGLKIVVIDHHETNIKWGAENIVDVGEISVSSMLYTLFMENNVVITKEIAEDLLTGLLTDSGFFAYIKTPKPLLIASELMKKGADYGEIIFRIQNQKYAEDLQFLGKALEQIQIIGRVVVLPVSNGIWKSYGKTTDKNYLLTDYVRSIKDTDFGVVIIEEQPGTFRLEFRSRTPGFDVSKIAKKVGGGGHIAAAGARIRQTTMDKTIQQVLNGF
jgi:phosphoesterase RecJ-like protein